MTSWALPSEEEGPLIRIHDEVKPQFKKSNLLEQEAELNSISLR